MDIDLDTLNKADTITLFGEKYEFNDLKVKEHFYNEFLLQELNKLPLDDKKNVEKANNIITEYLTRLLDIPKETAEKVTIKQFRYLQQKLERKDLYDQGFSDKEIDMIEKKAIKKGIA